MKFEYRKVEAFELAGIHFTLHSAWHGLEEWRDAKGRMVIVQRDRWVGLTGVFADIFDSSARELKVIAGTPDLMADLKVATARQGGAAVAAPQGTAEGAAGAPRAA